MVIQLKVKDMDIATGDVQIVILNEKDAGLLDLHHGDRVWVRKKRKKTLAAINIAESEKAVPPGTIGLFEEVLAALNVKHGDTVRVRHAKKPVSVNYIKKKLEGKELEYKETYEIVKDIVKDRLTSIELTSYVMANYTYGMSDLEIVDLTKAMMKTGSELKLRQRPIVDLHSIGGVPGNRTTMIVVPIVAAAGLVMPKTSSRAITSPAGTADTMEVLCPVEHSLKKLRNIIDKTGAFIVWGGAVNLAPADDRIIKVESPLGIDAEGQMLASIMAKKASVSSTHLLIEIPVGRGAKVRDRIQALHLKRHFERLSKELGMKVFVMITQGNEPVGNGIGPVLEARDCLWVLKNDKRAPQDLKQKSIEMAARLLEFVGKAKKGKGLEKAKDLLESGRAYQKMVEIIKAQGGKEVSPDSLKPGKHSKIVRAKKTCVLRCVNNTDIAKIARLAGAPRDMEAGVFLHKHGGAHVKKGDKLMTVYAKNRTKLKFAVDALKEHPCFETE